MQHFAQDRLEQYSHKESVRIYGIPESERETREDTNKVVLQPVKLKDVLSDDRYTYFLSLFVSI